MDRIVTFDDFYMNEKANILSELYNMRGLYPKFKATIFLVPGRCTDKFTKEVLKIPWLQCVPHGYLHDKNQEVKLWTEKEIEDILNIFEWLGMEKGFKAPNYEHTPLLVRMLKKRGYWIAVKEDQEEELLSRMWYYNFMKDKRAVNTHTWLFESDAKKGMFDFDIDDDFLFVSDVLRKT